MPNPAVPSGAAGTGYVLGHDAYTVPTAPAQVSPAALRHLADHVARQRQTRRERIRALSVAYSALRHADQLEASEGLCDAWIVVLDQIAKDRASLAELRLLTRCAGLRGDR